MKEYEQKCLKGDEPRILVTEKFIKDNKLSINIETAKNIIKDNDDIYFSSCIVIDFLPLDVNTKKYFNDEYIKDVESGKEKHTQITDVYEVAQDFLDYMVFAWMKANNERGLSASRSIEKLSVWMKILSRNDIAEVLNDDRLYNPYGKPALRKACKMLEIKSPDYI